MPGSIEIACFALPYQRIKPVFFGDNGTCQLFGHLYLERSGSLRVARKSISTRRGEPNETAFSITNY
jgi:hypothetical protein